MKTWEEGEGKYPDETEVDLEAVEVIKPTNSKDTNTVTEPTKD